MSRGRMTQAMLNILSSVTLAAAVALGLTFFVPRLAFGPVTWILFAFVLVLATGSIYAHRCRRCGHDVTKDGAGVRTHKSWPKVNATCAGCGADIP